MFAFDEPAPPPSVAKFSARPLKLVRALKQSKPSETGLSTNKPTTDEANAFKLSGVASKLGDANDKFTITVGKMNRESRLTEECLICCKSMSSRHAVKPCGECDSVCCSSCLRSRASSAR